ncbi:MAG: hypothetical protein Kow00129_00750 [Thermoleophilia bacterium]
MAEVRGSLTIIVRCSDPRLNRFFLDDEFRRRMGLPELASTEQRNGPGGGSAPLEATIANVGGLLPFSGRGPGGGERLAEDAGLLISLFADGEARILLTAHSSCGGYAASGESVSSELAEKWQRQDLREAAGALRRRLPEARIEGFFLRLETGEVEPVAV